MDRETTVVLENLALNSDHRMLVVEAPRLSALARPGQFAELATSGATLLRKPISIAMADKEKGTLVFVFRMIGKGTEYLGSLEPSSELDIIGPLGNGFDTNCGSALLIGGGVGTPPLPSVRASDDSFTKTLPFSFLHSSFRTCLAAFGSKSSLCAGASSVTGAFSS